jgi:hypothetical protein
MATETKRATATNKDNMGNGYGEEDDGRLMAAMMGIAQRTQGMAQRTRPLML